MVYTVKFCPECRVLRLVEKAGEWYTCTVCSLVRLEMERPEDLDLRGRERK